MDQRTLATNPEASPEELFRLVVQFPSEVLANPVLPLLALERPDVYQKIVTAAYSTISTNEVLPRVGLLTEEQQRAFCLACAAQVLPLHDRSFPERALVPLLDLVSSDPLGTHRRAQDAAALAEKTLSTAMSTRGTRSEVISLFVANDAAWALVYATQSEYSLRSTWDRAASAQRFEGSRAYILGSKRDEGTARGEMASALASLYQWARDYLSGL